MIRTVALVIALFIPSLAASQVGLAVSPSVTNVGVGSSVVLTATVTGLPNTAVIWTVREGGGSVDAIGVYTAPAAVPVTGHAIVRATSVADPTRWADVVIWIAPTQTTRAFDAPEVMPAGERVKIADMNGDGLPDFVQTVSSRIGSSIRVVLRTATGWAAKPLLDEPVFDFALGDLDHDGDTDVVIAAGGTTDGIRIALNNGTGVLSLGPRPFFPSGCIALALADFNGDGHTDIAAANNPGQSVSVLHGNGAGGFSLGVVGLSANGQGGVAAGDLTGDGRPDLVAGDTFFGSGITSRQLRVAINLGGGAWSTPIVYDVDFLPRAPVIGDFTGDGWGDIATGASNTVYLLANRGDGTGGLLAPLPVLETNFVVNVLTAAHLDGDGALDLVGAALPDVFLLPAAGGGAFGSAIWLSADQQFVGAAAADIDADGRLDLITGQTGGPTRIWRGLETGPFELAIDPTDARLNLTRRQQFTYLARNASSFLGGFASWTASAGNFGAGSNRSRYFAPSTMPASGPVVTITGHIGPGSPPVTAMTTITLTDFRFVAGATGSMRSVLFDPTEPRSVFFATDNGVLASNDGGVIASPLGTGLTVPVFELAFTVDPTSGHGILLAAAQNGLWRYDLSAGVSGAWTSSRGGVLAAQFSPIAAIESTVYAGQNAFPGTRLYKSVDGGLTWVPTTLAASFIHEVWAADAAHVWVSHSQGLAYSEDGGATWEERGGTMIANAIPLQSVAALAWDPANPDRMYAGLGDAIRGGAAFHSMDRGRTWTAIAGLAFDKMFGFALEPGTPTTIYAVGLHSFNGFSVWKSTDGGVSWGDITGGLPSDASFNLRGIAISPHDAGAVYLSGSTAVFATKFAGGGAEAPGVTVSPSQSSVLVGRTIALTATVTGLPDTSVTWTVREGGGSVDAAGVYTAPGSVPPRGYAIVRARSVADTTRFGDIVVWIAPELSTRALDAPEEIPGGERVQTADMNGDGLTDIVETVSSRLGTSLRVLLRRPGGWTPGPLLHESILDFALGDLDADGDIDIVIARGGTSGASDGLSVVLNDGAGALTLLPRPGLGDGYFKLALADFNGDGHLDVAAASASHSVVVLHGNGTGSFPTRAAALPHNGHGGVAAGDLNGDGRPDLVAGDTFSGSGFFSQQLRVAINLGSGGWNAPVVYDFATGFSPRAPIIADFTGDGWADVAVGASAAVYLLVNNADGSGGLAPPVEVLKTNFVVSALTAAHLDDDGQLDLVGLALMDMFVLPSLGGGAFGSAVWASSDNLFEGLAMADVDADGRRDLITGQTAGPTRIWRGLETGSFEMTIVPVDARVNLERSQTFTYLVRNAATFFGGNASWTASAGSFGAGSNRNRYTAPVTMPASGPLVTITAQIGWFSSALPASTTVTLTDLRLTAGAQGGIQTILPDAGDAERLYFGGSANGVLYSDDGGRTAHQLGTGIGGWTVFQLARTTDVNSGAPVLLAAAQNGLWRYDLSAGVAGAWVSSRGGVFLPSYTPIAAAGLTVYAGDNGFSGARIHKSIDGGLTWLPTPFVSTTIYRVWAVDSARIWVSHSGGLAYSADGGTTWEERGQSLMAYSLGGGIDALAWDPAHPDRLYGGLGDAIRGGAAFQSNDGGRTWTPLTALAFDKVFSFAIDPANPATLYAVGLHTYLGSSVFKSDDGGASWWDIGTGLPPTMVLNEAIVSPVDGAFVYIAGANGFFATAFPGGGGAPGLTLFPSVVNVGLGGSVVFTATVSGLANPSVTWAVVTGSGSIDASGVYTAPSSLPLGGYAIVRATAVADPARTGDALIWIAPALTTRGVDAPEEWPGGEQTRVADMNGDGRPDLVQTVDSRMGALLRVLLRTGTGWTTAGPAFGGTGIFEFALADLDHDDDVDVVIARGSANDGLEVLLNNGSGVLTVAPRPPSPFSGYVRVALADFNGDGHVDIAAASSVASVVEVFNGTGTGLFAQPRGALNGNGTGGLTVADLNGDGRPDLVAGDNLLVSGFTSRQLRVALNLGGGAWSQPVVYDVDFLPRSPAIGDFTGDGWGDVVVAASATVYLLANRGDGTGALLPAVPILETNFVGNALLPVHLDADGALDLVGRAGPNLFMLPSLGGGTFGPAAWIGVELQDLFTGAAVADIDADGRVDLITGHSSGKTRVWRGLETATFELTVAPTDARINLTRNLRFTFLARNAATFLGGNASWTASAGGFGTGSNSSQYVAPSVMPASGANISITVRVGPFSAPITQTFGGSLTDISFLRGANGSIWDVLVDPTDRMVVYLGTQTGVLRSVDGGLTASALGAGLSARAATVALTHDPTSDHRILLAATDVGLRRYDLTAGAAGSWQDSRGGSLLPQFTPIAAAGSIVYAGDNAFNGSRIFKSVDGGLTWQPSTFAGPSIQAVWAVDAMHIWVSHIGGLAYSADGGATWEERGAPLLANRIGGSIGALAWDPTIPDRLFAGLADAIRGGAAFRSNDGGHTWTPMALPLDKTTALAVDPATPTTLYATGTDSFNGATVWKSEDGGTSWWDISLGATLGVFDTLRDVAVSPHDPAIVYVGAGSGLAATAFPSPDNTPPILTCPAPSTISAGADGRAAAPDVLAGITVSDDTSPADAITLTQSPAAGSPLSVGVHTIMITATDEAGNVGTCAATITVIDNTPPVISGVPEPVTVEQAAAGGTPVPLALPSAHDNVDGVVEVTSTAPTLFPYGATVVTFRAIDAAGNLATETTIVTIIDTTTPVVVAPPPLTVGNDAGLPSALISDATLGEAAVTDNGEIVHRQRAGVPAGNVFPLGVTTVTYTATDQAGNTGTATQLVTVTDFENPLLSCPGDLFVTTDPGLSTATVAFAVTASDNAPHVSLVVSPTSGSVFALGVTTVRATATDSSGNTASCTFVVNVRDAEPPSITAPAAVSVSTDPGQSTAFVGAAALGTPTSTDNVAVDSVAIAGVPAGHVFPLGTTTITYTAADVAGNTASATQTVTVLDREPPVISCPADPVVPTDPRVAFAAQVTFSIIASDNAGDVLVVSTPASGATFGLGRTVVTVTATDAAGNSATCSFAVLVEDREPPALVAPGDIIVEAATSAGTVIGNEALGSATASDNVGVVSVVRTGVPAGNGFALGTTVVTYTARDAAGNEAAAIQRVTVRDTTVPQIVIATPEVRAYTLHQVVAAAFECSDAVSGIAACAGSVPNGAAIDTASPGPKAFTVSATDGAGNSASRSVSYSVGFGACLLYDSARAVRAGGTIPIKFQLCDAIGQNLSSQAIVVTATQIVKISDASTSAVADAGNANPDADFRFDASLGETGGYIFNLKTTGMSTGTYVVGFRVTGDPAVYATELVFQVR